MGVFDSPNAWMLGNSMTAQAYPFMNNSSGGTSGVQNSAAAPMAPPQYQSMVDPTTGKLLSQYAYDPNQSSAFSQMAKEAQSPDLTPWAKLQQQQNQLSAQNQKDLSAATAQGATDQARQAMMATGGGTNSGASAFLAAQGARNQMLGAQNINNQAGANNLSIEQADAQNKQQMLGTVASGQVAGLATNAQTQAQNLNNQNAWNANNYNQQMQAWGANQTANAQAVAANKNNGFLGGLTSGKK
jgi:hypothetical protein